MDSGEVQAEMKRAFDNNGMAGLKAILERKIDAWKEIPLRVGVTGRSGVGKSTFINTIRAIDAESEHAAATGVTETTKHVKEYVHPQNKQLVFCDLPGVGTGTFPRSTYLTDRTIGFDNYDMFIILTSGRIFEDDIWLAQTAKEKGKAYLFIRTKIDVDIASERKTKPRKFQSNPNAENELVIAIRSELEDQLREGGVFSKTRVFLIDCTDLSWHTFDFDILVSSILTSFPQLKREALVMSLTAKTPDLIKEKVNVMRSRLWLVSCISGVVGAVPVPGLSIAVDGGLVLAHAASFRKQLGLTNEDIKRVASECGVSVDRLKRETQLKSCAIVWTATGLVRTVSADLVLISIEETSKYIPIIGSIVAGATSFWSTQYILGQLLDMFESDALILDRYMRSRATSV